MNPLRKKIEEELERLESEGKLTPEEVVEAARNPDSVLHEEIWFDTEAEAAMEARYNRARSLIRSVKVEVRTSTIVLNATRYVHDPSLPPKEAGYISITRLRTDDERARQALMAETQRVKNSADRARDIAVGIGLESEVEEMLQHAVAANGRSQPPPTAATTPTR